MLYRHCEFYRGCCMQSWWRRWSRWRRTWTRASPACAPTWRAFGARCCACAPRSRCTLWTTCATGSRHAALRFKEICTSTVLDALCKAEVCQEAVHGTCKVDCARCCGAANCRFAAFLAEYLTASRHAISPDRLLHSSSCLAPCVTPQCGTV